MTELLVNPQGELRLLMHTLQCPERPAQQDWLGKTLMESAGMKMISDDNLVLKGHLFLKYRIKDVNL